MGLLDSIKTIVQDVVQTAQSSASAANTPLTTASTTKTEQNASVWSAEQNNAQCNNKSSTTVILSSDYRNVDKNSWTDTYKLKQGDSVDIKKIMNNTYGTQAVKCMSEGERQSAMQSIIDNNRWMMDCVNETYEMAQVADTVEKQLEDAGIENVNANMVSAIVERIYNPPKFSADEGDDEQQLQEQQQKEKNDFIDSLKLQLPEGAEFSLDSVLEAGKKVKENPQHFNNNMRTDQIPSEIIEATDFSIPVDNDNESMEIFVPDLNTLAHNGTKVDEQLSMTINFAANNPTLSISAKDLEGKSEEEAKQYIENQIAKNYGLYDGTNDVDITSSYAGIGIMAALGKEEGNNDVFARMDEDPSAFIDAMYSQAMSDKGLTLYCPDTEINALYDEKTLSNLMDENGGISEDRLRAFFAQEDNAGTITYIHANEDSLMPYEDDEGNSILTGSDILNAYEFNGKTLANLALNGNSGDKELALSAFEQIASNNPNMEQNAYNQYITSLNLEEGQTKPSLESLTTEQKLEMYLNADYSKTAKANDGEIILENIQYILNKGTPTPVTLADEVQETPTVPETPTEPEVTTPTDPEPTDPIPTDPEPTDPIPTDPEPTDPIPTDPEPTTPTTSCPEEPEVDKSDENLDITRPPKLNEPETSEAPTQAPETPSETPSSCPEEPEVTRPEEGSTEAPQPTQAPSETPTEAATTCPTEAPQGNTDYTDNDVTGDETGFASQNSPQTSSNEAAAAQETVQQTVQEVVQETVQAAESASAASASASAPAVSASASTAESTVQEVIEELES